jgi:DegV family protein with EDD domain
VGLFKELYETCLKEFNEVFVVVLSSKLSGCFNSATQAVAMLDDDKRGKVHIIESPSTSSGSAFIVQELISLLKSNTPVEKIKQAVGKMLPHLHLVAMIEDSYWLQKGGRMSPAIALIVNQMKKIGIRPLLAAIDGKLALLKVRTNAKSKKQALYDYINSEIGDKKVEIIITHADNKQEADSLKTLFQEHKPKSKVLYVNQLSPVLGAHVGPDSLVVGWKVIA